MSDYTVWFSCPQCGSTFSGYESDIETSDEGEWIECPDCGEVIGLPPDY